MRTVVAPREAHEIRLLRLLLQPAVWKISQLVGFTVQDGYRLLVARLLGPIAGVEDGDPLFVGRNRHSHWKRIGRARRTGRRTDQAHARRDRYVFPAMPGVIVVIGSKGERGRAEQQQGGQKQKSAF